jgi:hypothetical protein
MSDRPIALVDASYLNHLAQASKALGSSAPIDRLFATYDVRFSDQVVVEMTQRTKNGDSYNFGRALPLLFAFCS